MTEPVAGAPTVAVQLPDQSDSTRASGLVFVLSGPSGVGKSTIVEHLKRDGFPITYCVTATTRARRNGEIDGVHYLFVSEEKYDEFFKTQNERLMTARKKEWDAL